jgi:glutaconate CoA-transferase subunit A
MSLVRAILRSDLQDLHLVSYGGPDVGMLCAAGKVSKLTFAFVSLDSIPLEPHFRNARQSGAIECVESDEGLFLLGLQAAAWRVPFLPTRVGLGSDLMELGGGLATVTSPYPSADGTQEDLIAAPALRLDAALVHLNRADELGNGSFLGPDLYMDDLFLEAADAGYVSAEKVVPVGTLIDEADLTRLRINRLYVDGVVEAPNGAHPTHCEPDYGRDEAFQREYALTAGDAEQWAAFREQWLSFPDEASYQRALEARS